MNWGALGCIRVHRGALGCIGVHWGASGCAAATSLGGNSCNLFRVKLRQFNLERDCGNLGGNSGNLGENSWVALGCIGVHWGGI